MNTVDSNNDYISLKDVILKISEYAKYLYTKKIGILLFSAFFAAFYYFINRGHTPIYRENLTFMMDESKGDALQGFGLFDGLFGKSGSTGNTGIKLLKLFESKRIIHNTLFDTINVEGKPAYIANFILDSYSLDELCGPYKSFGNFSWKESWPQALQNSPSFRFKHGNTDDFNKTENQYLRLLYEFISGNANIGLPSKLNSSMDEETGIMTLTMESGKEMLTLSILNKIYGHLSGFFIEKAAEKQTKTFKIMKEKRDSIIWALKRAEFNLADFKDRNRNLVTVKGYLEQVKLERDVMVLNSMYAEAVKQMEVTDFALKNTVPVVQIIDIPRSPIVPTSKSWKKQLVIGLAIGTFLSVALMIILKIFKDIMKN